MERQEFNRKFILKNTLVKGWVGKTAKGKKLTNAASSSKSSLWATGAYALRGALGRHTTQLSEFSHRSGEGAGET